MARAYDDALRPAGIKSTQFTLLAAIQHNGTVSIGKLSEILVIDGTTLTRNLDLLERRGLIEEVSGKDGRMRLVRLTTVGKTTHDLAFPLWKAAQINALSIAGEDDWKQARSTLSALEQVPEK